MNIFASVSLGKKFGNIENLLKEEKDLIS